MNARNAISNGILNRIQLCILNLFSIDTMILLRVVKTIFLLKSMSEIVGSDMQRL